MSDATPEQIVTKAVEESAKIIDAMPRAARTLAMLQGLALQTLEELGEAAKAAGHLNPQGGGEINPADFRRDFVLPVLAGLAELCQELQIASLEEIEHDLIAAWTTPPGVEEPS